MVGLVLERMGRALEGDPARLIQSYLTTCLTKGDARDFAKPVLEPDDHGGRAPKEPRAEADLAASARLEPWQVEGDARATSRSKGLVRRLEGRRARSGRSRTISWRRTWASFGCSLDLSDTR